VGEGVGEGMGEGVGTAVALGLAEGDGTAVAVGVAVSEGSATVPAVSLSLFWQAKIAMAAASATNATIPFERIMSRRSYCKSILGASRLIAPLGGPERP
jgi:hypothetical protein